MAAGRFREDLYYRIRVFEIESPPLREHREDIPLLVNHFLSRLNTRLKRNVVRVDREAMQVLTSAPWRGNVRELENTLERAVLLTEGDSIRLDDLPIELTHGVGTSDDAPDDLRKALQIHEREHIQRVLAATGGNREEAARRLGVDISTLYRHLKALDI